MEEEQKDLAGTEEEQKELACEAALFPYQQAAAADRNNKKAVSVVASLKQKQEQLTMLQSLEMVLEDKLKETKAKISVLKSELDEQPGEQPNLIYVGFDSLVPASAFASSRTKEVKGEAKEEPQKLSMRIQLIEHVSGCVSKTCSSSNCAKMKSYLHHASICRVKVQGGCKICKRIWTLLRIHAQKCKKPKCPIPQCNAVREKMRQLQQAIDGAGGR